MRKPRRSWLAQDGTRFRSYYHALAWTAFRNAAVPGAKLRRRWLVIPLTWPDGSPVISPRTGRQLVWRTAVYLELPDGTVAVPSARHAVVDALLDALGYRVVYLTDQVNDPHVIRNCLNVEEREKMFHERAADERIAEKANDGDLDSL